MHTGRSCMIFYEILGEKTVRILNMFMIEERSMEGRDMKDRVLMRLKAPPILRSTH